MGLCNIGGKDGYLRKMIADKLVALGVTAAKAYDSAAQFVTNIQTAVTNANTAGYNSGVSATKQGTASEGQVLDGYTFTNQTGLHNGSMPNRGTLNWNPSTDTTYTVPSGYYTGGTLNSHNAYSAGNTSGKSSVNGGIAVPNPNTSVTKTFPAGNYMFIFLRYSPVSAAYAGSVDISISGSNTPGTTSYWVNEDGAKLGRKPYTLNGECSVTISCSSPTSQTRCMGAFVKV